MASNFAKRTAVPQGEEPYRCCACDRPFRNDAMRSPPGMITCPYCLFRQFTNWAIPGRLVKTQKINYSGVKI